MQPGPCAPPTSNLNTESARLFLSLSKEKKREREGRGKRERESEREARTGIEEGWTRMGRKRREREAEGCTGFVGYVGPTVTVERNPLLPHPYPAF